MNNFSTKIGNLFDKGINKQIYQKEIAIMFKIVCFPKKLESFFDSLKNQFHWDHFEYLRTLVLLVTISWGRRNISALYRHLDGRHQPHRKLKVLRFCRQNNIHMIWTPTNASWLNPIECQFTHVKEFVIRGTNYQNHNELKMALNKYVKYRNKHTQQK